MDSSSSPWRSFEAPELQPDAGGAGPNPSASRAAPKAAVPRGLLLAIVIAMALLIAGAALLGGGGSAQAEVTIDTAGDVGAEAATGEPFLIVDVAGAVAHPGVYHLAPGSRVGDAIAIAGGYGPRVDAGRVAIELNLAAPLADGQHLLVPSRDDVATGGGAISQPGAAGGVTTGGGSAGSGGLVDLNRATAAELDTLPGIGPATAAKIISSRESSSFKTVDDLKDRKLVGQKTFDGLRDLVTVR